MPSWGPDLVNKLILFYSISKHLQLLIGLIKAHTLYKKGLSMLHFRFSIHTLYKKGLSMLHFRFSIDSNKHILVHYF
jgi:hypothetical protein